jgi:AraC family transcriptional regulator
VNWKYVSCSSSRCAWPARTGSAGTQRSRRGTSCWPGRNRKGLLDDRETHRIFGFNNPDPSPGSPNYGYEFWIVIGPEVEAEGEVKIKEIPGGLYAVTRCEVRGDAYEIIPGTWKRLAEWCEDSKYRCAFHQWLEEHIMGDTSVFDLDLYLPIAE